MEINTKIVSNVIDRAMTKVFQEIEIVGRKTTIYGTIDEPLFLAKDIADIIEHSDVSMMLNNVDEDEKTKLVCDTNNVCTTSSKARKTQEMWFLTENGLYEVLMQSRKPIAKEFKRAVKKILHEVRTKGSYHSPFIQYSPRLEDFAFEVGATEIMANYLRANDNSRLMMIRKVAQKSNMEYVLPDYTISKGVLHSATYLLNQIGSNMKAIKFNQLLEQAGILERKYRTNSKGKQVSFWSITDKGKQYGENQVSEKNPKETQPQWYNNAFQQLYSSVMV